jgi:hypothetical protein
MYSTENNQNINRETYPYVGKWVRGDNDINEDIFFHYVENKSFRLEFNGRIQGITSTATIAVFGAHTFVPNDTIILEDGTKLRIQEILGEVKEQVNYRILHLIKPRIIEQVLALR